MKRVYFLFYALIALLQLSCKKYLDAKPDKQLVIPSTLSDLQALLDEATKMNLKQPKSGEGSADDYYLTYIDWMSITNEGNRNTYIWAGELYFNTTPNEWSELYDVVYVSNIILEHIENIERTIINQNDWDNAKGSAHFYRAYSFFRGAQLWTKAYDEPSAGMDLGLPLRLNSDFNIPSVRSTVQQTYSQIIQDALLAVKLLPANPVHKMRPSRPAAYALLARTYLSMRNYQKAGLYADSCLQLANTLLDYKDQNAGASFPFSRFNNEVVFHALMSVPQNLSNSRAKIDSNLYNLYGNNDLRKTLFFKSNGNGTFGFKGSYDGGGNLFTGITTAEMLLTRAECKARYGDKDGAMDDLNTLLVKRWKPGTFTPLSATDPLDALNKVKTERRKELLMRDIRWMDIKRYNKEGANMVIRRNLNSQLYELQPNDLRFALPLPAYVINMTGMEQNPR